jgi:hypothetical protein
LNCKSFAYAQTARTCSPISLNRWQLKTYNFDVLVQAVSVLSIKSKLKHSSEAMETTLKSSTRYTSLRIHYYIYIMLAMNKNVSFYSCKLALYNWDVHESLDLEKHVTNFKQNKSITYLYKPLSNCILLSLKWSPWKRKTSRGFSLYNTYIFSLNSLMSCNENWIGYSVVMHVILIDLWKLLLFNHNIILLF